MRKLSWFLFGLASGVVAAHFVNMDPRGHEVLAQVDARITEFTDRIGSAYRDQEARFAGPATTGAVSAAGSDASAPVADDGSQPSA